MFRVPTQFIELSTDWSRCRQEALLFRQDRRIFDVSRRTQDEAMKEQKNRNFDYKEKEKKEQQSKQLSYIINLPQRWIFAPTWLLSYDTRDPRLCKNVAEVWNTSVCVYVFVLCPAVTGQNICWMQSGQVREEKKAWAGMRMSQGWTFRGLTGDKYLCLDSICLHWPTKITYLAFCCYML